jgi:site-specific DNA-methyltransferase (adenine-specific)
LNLNGILKGDCLELMKEIPDGKIDMILCDLPYATTHNSWDKSVIPFPELWEEYQRIIKENGAIVLTASGSFTKELILSNPKLFKYEWIWIKNRVGNFANAKKMPMRNHEQVLVFYKKLPTYNPQGLKPNPNPNKKKSGKKIGDSYQCKSLTTDYIQEFTGYPNSILYFDSETGYHPTQKPVPLFEYLIKTYTNEGDVVLDNCAGSGTTGIACLNTNRNYILMEQDDNYYKLILKRMFNIC